MTKRVEELEHSQDSDRFVYFRATDNAKLQSIYDEINQLEKSKVEISQYTTYTEEYLRWAAAALALLLVEFLLRTLWLKSLP